MMRKIALTVALVALTCSQTPASHGESFRKKEFQSRYRAILDSYAAGDVEDALEALVGLESTSFPAADPTSFTRLLRAKLEVLRDPMSVDLKILVPVALFHEQAFLAYQQRGLAQLAGHSREMAIGLSQIYAGREEDPEGRRAAADLLASLGGHLQEGTADRVAARLYAEALELAPSHEAALLGLATAYERVGDPGGAVPYLRRLVEAHADHSEGRLRLALTLYRSSSRHDEPRQILRQLLRNQVPDWILSLAYQELARELLAEDDLDAAWSLLHEGMARLPLDPILPIQLAHVGDRKRTTRFDLAPALQRCAQTCMVSPRYIYSQAPRQALDELRERLHATLPQRLELLARALSRVATTESAS